MDNNTILNNRYEIIRPVGSGGMAEVYLAHDTLLDRNVAIKMLRNQFLSDRDLLEQFRREAKSAARLIHPYIVNIYDVISEGGAQYIVMEYVEGVNLKRYLAAHRLPLKAVLEIGVRLADALQHAHSRNVIHCDVKPQNILIDKNLNPKIADFGIAKMITNQTMVYTTSVMGSVHYISPEQASGGKITACSDIYSLGIVLFEMLTGRVPFTGETPVAVAMMHVEKPVPPLSAFMDHPPEGLQQILDRALAKKLEDRYHDAGELRRDLLELQLKLFPSGVDDYTAEVPFITDTPPELKESDGETTVIMRPVRSEEMQAAPGREYGPAERGDMAMTRRRNSRKKKKFNFNKMMVMLTVIVVLISAAAHFFFSRSRETVAVPNVIGATVVEAQKTLEEKGFKVDLEERYGEKTASGLVMEQSPREGEQRKTGTQIVLVISKGAELKEVPDVVGLNRPKAEALLEDAGYEIGEITKKLDKTHRLGTVLNQKPSGRNKAPKGSKIDLVINEGGQQVPNLIGQPLSNAAKLLHQEGLLLGAVKNVRNNAPRGTIIAMEPAPGSSLGEHEKVALTVSDGSGADGGAAVTAGSSAAAAASGSTVSGRYIDFVVPGSKEQHVQIYISDSRGRRLVYDGTQRGGVRLRQKAEAGSNAKIQFYCDNKLVEEKTL